MEQWRAALRSSPDTVITKVRNFRNSALRGAADIPGAEPTYRSYLAAEVPFGNGKTAAYLMFGLADVADLLEAGRSKEAEALCLMLLSSGEQAALQGWTWGLAWALTFAPAPPWNRIRRQPVPEDSWALSRLADPGLLAATISYLKDTAAVADAQMKAGFPAPSTHAVAEDDQAAQGVQQRRRPKAKAKSGGQSAEHGAGGRS